MITPRAKQDLRRLLESPQWATLEAVRDAYCAQVRSQPVVADTEWETARRAVEQAAKVRGVTEFLQQVIELANQST